MSKSKRAPAPIASPVLKCRKGDLALLLRGKRVGQIVEVSEYYPTVELSDGRVYVRAWRIRHPSDELTPRVRHFGEDKWMLPIRPGDLNETETDNLVQEVGK